MRQAKSVSVPKVRYKKSRRRIGPRQNVRIIRALESPTRRARCGIVADAYNRPALDIRICENSNVIPIPLRPTLPATSLNGRKPLRAAQTALRVASPVPERVREKIELYAMWAIWVSTRSRPVALA